MMSPRAQMLRKVKLDFNEGDPESQEPISVLEVNKAMLMDRPPALEDDDFSNSEEELSDISCTEEKPISDLLKELQEASEEQKSVLEEFLH